MSGGDPSNVRIPKKAYIRKMRSHHGSDSGSTGDVQVSTSDTSSIKSPGSLSDLELSEGLLGGGENPDSVGSLKNLSSSPWTPPSWGSILSPATPNSGSGGGVGGPLQSPRQSSVLQSPKQQGSGVNSPSSSSTVTTQSFLQQLSPKGLSVVGKTTDEVFLLPSKSGEKRCSDGSASSTTHRSSDTDSGIGDSPQTLQRYSFPPKQLLRQHSDIGPISTVDTSMIIPPQPISAVDTSTGISKSIKGLKKSVGECHSAVSSSTAARYQVAKKSHISSSSADHHVTSGTPVTSGSKGFGRSVSMPMGSCDSSQRPRISGKRLQEMYQSVGEVQSTQNVSDMNIINVTNIKQEVVDYSYSGAPMQVPEVCGSTSEISLCQVCGDIAAGFHCGAFVCEACKKFFVRCVKSEQIKFSCPRSQSCVVTRETRTQCQACRYQKCIQLGMYKPGGTNISSQISHIPCSVCGAPSSGYHFGAITCEGCKGFFRRTVKERDTAKYQCSRGNNCSITSTTRNICKFCRYKKCLEVGMKPDGSRIGRQPNAVKHVTMLQLQEIKMAKGLPVDFEVKPQPLLIKGGMKEDISECTELPPQQTDPTRDLPPQQADPPRDKLIRDVTASIITSMKDTMFSGEVTDDYLNFSVREHLEGSNLLKQAIKDHHRSVEKQESFTGNQTGRRNEEQVSENQPGRQLDCTSHGESNIPKSRNVTVSQNSDMDKSARHVQDQGETRLCQQGSFQRSLSMDSHGEHHQFTSGHQDDLLQPMPRNKQEPQLLSKNRPEKLSSLHKKFGSDEGEIPKNVPSQEQKSHISRGAKMVRHLHEADLPRSLTSGGYGRSPDREVFPQGQYHISMNKTPCFTQTLPTVDSKNMSAQCGDNIMRREGSLSSEDFLISNRGASLSVDDHLMGQLRQKSEPLEQQKSQPLYRQKSEPFDRKRMHPFVNKPADKGLQLCREDRTSDLLQRGRTGTSPGELGQRIQTGTYPGELGQRIQTGTNPGELGQRMRDSSETESTSAVFDNIQLSSIPTPRHTLSPPPLTLPTLPRHPLTSPHIKPPSHFPSQASKLSTGSLSDRQLWRGPFSTGTSSHTVSSSPVSTDSFHRGSTPQPNAPPFALGSTSQPNAPPFALGSTSQPNAPPSSVMLASQPNAPQSVIDSTKTVSDHPAGRSHLSAVGTLVVTGESMMPQERGLLVTQGQSTIIKDIVSTHHNILTAPHLYQGSGHQMSHGSGLMSQGTGHQMSQESGHQMSQESGHQMSHGSGLMSQRSGHQMSQESGHQMSHGSGHQMSHGSGHQMSHGSGHQMSHGSGHQMSLTSVPHHVPQVSHHAYQECHNSQLPTTAHISQNSSLCKISDRTHAIDVSDRTHTNQNKQSNFLLSQNQSHDEAQIESHDVAELSCDDVISVLPVNTTDVSAGDTEMLDIKLEAITSIDFRPEYEPEGCPENPPFQSKQVIEIIQKAFKELAVVVQRCPDIPDHIVMGINLTEAWDVQMKQFSQCAHAALKFAKKVPGFRKLPIQEQISRIQESMYPIVVVLLSTDYHLRRRQYNYFNMNREEEEVILSLFPDFRPLIQCFHILGFSVQSLRLDSTEISFLCAFKLMAAVKEEYYEDVLLNALSLYYTENGIPGNRLGEVLLRLTEMARVNQIHTKCVIKMSAMLMKEGLQIPQLFQESFLND